MDMMVRLRTARRLAWLLASAISIPSLSVYAMAAPRVAPPAAKSVVVFPMESAESVTNTQVATELDSLLRDALSTYPSYKVVIFNDRLPAVQRLVATQPDKKTLTSGPFTTDRAGVDRAIALGRAMSADLLVIGTVERYVFNDKAGTADITVNVQLIDGTTGKRVTTAPVAGRGVGKTTQMEGVSEAAVRSDAVKDAVRNVMKAVTGTEYNQPVQSSAPVASMGSKKSKSAWVPLLILSLGVGVLLGGSGGHSGGSPADTGGTENPPPPPL